MSKLHHSDSEPGWIRRELAKANQRITENAAARRLEAATIGKGGVTITEGGDLLLKAAGTVVWQASVDPLKFDAAFDATGGLNLPTSWTRFGDTAALTVAVPPGFRSSEVHMHAYAADIFDTNGWVSVRPAVTFTRQSSATETSMGAVVTGRSGDAFSSAASFLARTFDGGTDDPYVSITYGLDVIESANANTTAGQWIVTASAVFKRGV